MFGSVFCYLEVIVGVGDATAMLRDATEMLRDAMHGDDSEMLRRCYRDAVEMLWGFSEGSVGSGEVLGKLRCERGAFLPRLRATNNMIALRVAPGSICDSTRAPMPRGIPKLCETKASRGPKWGWHEP